MRNRWKRLKKQKFKNIPFRKKDPSIHRKIQKKENFNNEKCYSKCLIVLSYLKGIKYKAIVVAPFLYMFNIKYDIYLLHLQARMVEIRGFNIRKRNCFAPLLLNPIFLSCFILLWMSRLYAIPRFFLSFHEKHRPLCNFLRPNFNLSILY